jgi:tetratricopeptide (TPR) repeat protein
MGLKNEEGELTMFLPREPFKYFNFSLTKDRLPVSVVSTWSTEIRKIRDPDTLDANADDLYRLEPRSSVQSLVGLRREDAQPFDAGLYRLTVQTTIVKELRLTNGLPWSGRVANEMNVEFRIAEVKNFHDMKKQLQLEGAYNLKRGRVLEASEIFRRLVDLDPDDVNNYVPLGNAYFRLKRFRDAIDAFEKSLWAKRSGRTTVPYSLAYAYVAEGNDQMAHEVLRTVLPESRIPDELQRYKAQLVKKREVETNPDAVRASITELEQGLEERP